MSNLVSVTVGAILTAAPAEWTKDFQPNKYPVQRRFQWLRNGVAIPGATGSAYTTQDADVGKSISLREEAWYLSSDNSGTKVEIPIVTAQSISNSIVVTGSQDESLVYQDDLTYVGSFKLPAIQASDVKRTMSYGGHGLTLNSNGFGGQKTMFSVGYASDGYSYAGEISIPTVTAGITPSQYPFSALLRPPTSLVSPSEGQLTSSGIIGDVDPETWGLQVIPGSGKMLVTGLNWYSSNTYNAFWRRPADLTVQNQVEGPFVVLDPDYQTNPRWTSGWMCDIPTEYQVDLGGNMLASLCGISVTTNASNGPSAIVFNTDDIDTALLTQHSGFARGGSERTIILADTASAITGTYVGQYIYVPSAATTAHVITAYDGATKTATIAPDSSSRYWDISVPTSSSAYRTSPIVPGRQVIGYPTGNEIQEPSLFNPVWRDSMPRGMCIPNGTRSLLFFGGHGEGPISFGTPGNQNEIGVGFKIYDPEGANKEYHSYPYSTKVWAYDINDLIQVKNNTKTFDQIQPYAVWTIRLPGKDSYTGGGIQGVTYDPSSKRIYISQQVIDNYQGSGEYGTVIVHAYECTRAAAAPGIAPTTLPPIIANTYFSAELSATGVQPITWSIPNGTLPTGLTLNTSTGVISGTPEVDAFAAITVRATNSVGFEEKTLFTAQSLSGVSVSVAPVVNGVTGSYQTLGSFTQLSSWVDGTYTQDFWSSGTQINETSFILSREFGTDRVELWIYQPPAHALRPADGGNWTPPTTQEIENDRTYDIRITVNGSLITPQYSNSTTTRVLCAPGTVRRLVSQFKEWDWNRVDVARSAYRLPSYDANTLLVSSAPTTLANEGLTNLPEFSHATIGGTSSALWFDGVRSAQGGDYISSRSVNHSWEAYALSERKNGNTTNLAIFEDALRKSAEYSGTFPQYFFLDSTTFKPIDSQRGDSPWMGGAFPQNYTPKGIIYVPGRANYGWDAAHHYNNGHVAFEATRDPFYALLQQSNSFAALSELSLATKSSEAKAVDPGIVGNTPYWEPVGALPFYLANTDQVRSRWWTVREIAKSYLISTQCPAVDFLQSTSTWNKVNNDIVTQFNSYVATIDNAVLPTSVNSLETSDQAMYVAQRILSCYMKSPYSHGSVPSTPGSPTGAYVSTFMNEYGVSALTFVCAAGLTQYQSALEKIIGFSINKVLYAGGQRSVPTMGVQGGSTPIAPQSTTASGGYPWTVVPIPFTSPQTWANYWVSADSVFASYDPTKFKFYPPVASDATFVQIITSAIRAVKELNDIGRLSIRVSEINAAYAAVNAQIAATTKYTGHVLVSHAMSWGSTAGSGPEPITGASPTINIWRSSKESSNDAPSINVWRTL